MSRVGGEWDGKGWLGLAASMTCSATLKHAPKIEILGEFGVIFCLSRQILSIKKLEPRTHLDKNSQNLVLSVWT
jgi:hypothetical protein